MPTVTVPEPDQTLAYGVITFMGIVKATFSLLPAVIFEQCGCWTLKGHSRFHFPLLLATHSHPGKGLPTF